MNYYSEIIKGGVFNRGNVLKLPDNKLNIDLDYYNSNVINAFHSIFLHTKEYQDFIELNGNQKGYNGRVYSRALFWDLDSDNFDLVREEAKIIVDRLKYFEPNNIQIYFSGNKGFHIIYYCPELEIIDSLPNINQIIKGLCTRIANGIETFDSRIYDKTRVFRTPNSIHGSTRLYKIPITEKELKNVSNIIELAQNQRKIEGVTKVHQHNKSILRAIERAIKQDNSNESTGGSFAGTELLTGISNGFVKGQRNTGMASVAGLLHSRGFDDVAITAFLYSINDKNDPPLSEREIDRIVVSISKYEIDNKYQELKTDDIVTIKEAGRQWKEVITTNGYCSFGNRFEHINKKLKLCIPGDLIGIVANSGVGKTSICMELGNNEAKENDLYSLFASLEMSNAGVFFRAGTIEHNPISNNVVSSEQVATSLLKNEDFFNKVCNEWKNILIVDKGGMSIDQIVEYFKLAQEKTGNKISNLIIDYAQNMDKAEDIVYAMRMARKLKEVAKLLKTKLFVVMQCNKGLEDEYTEIKKNNIEGAGAYFQACDYILSFWRSVDDMSRLHAKFMKDRWGECEYKFDFVRNGMKFHTENYHPDRGSLC